MVQQQLKLWAKIAYNIVLMILSSGKQDNEKIQRQHTSGQRMNLDTLKIVSRAASSFIRTLS
jgi:hypothetical protein